MTDTTSDRAFLGISSLGFIASAVGVFFTWRSMTGGMPMPTGLSAPSVWMELPGQSWPGMAATFLVMWIVMMVAMMLPSLVPVLLGYRRSLRLVEQTNLGGLTALAILGYYAIWAVFGAVSYPLSTLLAMVEMQSPALERLAPVATGVVILLAGCFQFTRWKARQLGHCRDMPGWSASSFPGARSAWQYGLRLGVHCCLCCSGFMIILLVTGMMNLGNMALLAAAITAERLAPTPERVSRLIGVIVLVAGALVIARALGVA